MAHRALELNKSLLPDLQNVTQRLRENFNIFWFEYIKIHSSGRRLYLSNNQEWLEKYLKKNLQDDKEHNKILWGETDKKYSLWMSLERTKVLSEHYKNDMWNGLFIHSFLNKGVREVFSFSSRVQNYSVNDFFINEPDILNKVIFIFHQDIYPKLESISSDCFIFPTHPSFLQSQKVDSSQSYDIEEFYRKTKISRYYFNHGLSDSFYLTRMEFICLTLLSQGKSLKEIACETNTSPRTIESHINAIKNKTGYTCRSQLISILNESPFSFTKDYLKKFLIKNIH